MYALTYCYQADGQNEPSATTIAVSEDKEKLKAEMARCIKEDTYVPQLEDYEDEFEFEDAKWDDSANFKVVKDYGDSVYLQHNERDELWVVYQIGVVNVL